MNSRLRSTIPTPDTRFRRTLYSDDCLNVLNDELALPTGSVDLIYLDPPFNSRSVYNLPFVGKDKDTRPVEAFHDTWTWGADEDAMLADLEAGPETRNLADIVKLARLLDPQGRGRSIGLPAYLVNMAVRLMPMRRVLAPKGSIYLHCDDTAVHYLKLLMDAIFGQGLFRTQIVWKRNSSHNDSRAWRRITDTILFYGESIDKDAVRVPLDEDYRERAYRYEDERGKFRIGDLTAKGLTGGGYFYDFHGHPGPWRYPEERMQEIEEAGLVYLPSKPNGVPAFKRYLDTNKGQVPPNLWADIPKLEGYMRERLGYPTQKPVTLLERIIKASCPPDGLVLDPFCGCGTTVDAAESLGRRWIGIDISRYSVGLMQDRVLRNFPQLTVGDIRVRGVPIDVAGAEDLAARDPFEFEKWVCGALGAEGMFREPGERGADGGVDGVLRFYPLFMGETAKPAYAIVQVKGGRVTADAVKALKATVDRYGAMAGVMVCFERFMRTVENQRDHSTFSDDADTYPVIQGLSVEALLRREPLHLPLYGRFDGRRRRKGRARQRRRGTSDAQTTMLDDGRGDEQQRQ